MPPLLHADERQPQLGDRVTDEVVRPFVAHRDQDRPPVDDRGQAGSGQPRRKRPPPSSTSTASIPVCSVKSPSGAARAACRPRSRQGSRRPARSRRAGATRRSSRSRTPAGPPDQLEHLVAAGRVEPVRRLVEEQQARIVDEGLGELDPLLHAGRVAADRPVALLVQPDVAGGPRRSARGPRSAAGRTSARGGRRRLSPRRQAAGSRARACSRRTGGCPVPWSGRRGRRPSPRGRTSRR